MATRMREAFTSVRDELRYEPTEKRIRAMLGDHTVADSTRALLVWEPRRVVGSYAVPAEDFDAELVPFTAQRDDDAAADAPLLHTGFPFGVHSTAGEALSVRVGDETREDAAFRPADPDLAAYVVLDFHAFDQWLEEDEPILAHPRDPFHRVDILRSSRHVRVESDGELLAETDEPYLVFETGLPLRFYIPRSDVRVELQPTEKRTYCAYKGEATWLSADVNGVARSDLVWSYEHPLRQATEITGRVAFLDERVDLIVDGERRERPTTALSKSIVEEAGL